MDIDKLLLWMRQEFRTVLTRPQHLGGVGWPKNDCVRTAKMAIALLRRFDVPAREISMRLFIANQTLTKWMADNGKELPFISVHEMRKVPGAFMIFMGRREGAEPIKGHWRGHLPVIVRDEYLLDLTLDVVNDMSPGFQMEPISVHLNTPQVEHIDSGQVFVIAGNGHHLMYQADKENTSYKETQAWTVWSDMHESIIDACERRAREVLDEAE